MKTIKKIPLILIIVLCLFLFNKQNEKNYEKHNEIRFSYIEHPENLPTKEAAKNTGLGFNNLKADIYRLQAIQYIGGNALRSEYKKYLYKMLDVITELNPYFEHPYLIGQLLLPDYNQNYENLTEEEQEINNKQAELIGLKGIENFCDKNKIDIIKNESNLNKIWSEEKFQDPCKGYKIPYYLAYVYYEYLKDPTTSSLYYKIASANKDSLEGSKIMAAIMQGKGGEREKSFFMFINLAQFVQNDNEICNKLSDELNEIGKRAFIFKDIEVNGNLIKQINKTRELAFGEYDKENDLDNQCDYYINKSIRELNLVYIQNANEIYKNDNNGKSTINAKELFDKKYISYLPIDFQKGDEHSIIYTYDEELGVYDYEMGKY